MATFGSIKNKINCSITALGTGTKNCAFEIKLINGIYAIKRNTTIADGDTFDKTYLQGLVQAGKAIPLINAIGFVDNSADDTIQETQSGVKIKANLGRYEFQLEYKKGEYFNKALSSLDSFGAYDIIIVDEAGSFLMTENKSGLAKGFKAGLFSPEKRKFNDATVATTKMLTFQLLDRGEFDDRLVWLDASELDFSPDEVDGINDITASYNVAPSDTDTTVIVDLVSAADSQTALEGLVDADFLVTVDGVTTATTWVESATVPGRYTGTLAALATNEVVIVQLYDSSANKNVIIKDDCLYRSNALTATVV